MGVRGGGGAAGIAATVGMATGTETSKVSPGLRFAGITTFILRAGSGSTRVCLLGRGGAHSWPLMLYWTVSPGDL